MKKTIFISAILLAFAFSKAEARSLDYIVGGYFYTELSPYGTWIEIDNGIVVWRPTIMHTSWSPYRVGRWVWTLDGWYWDSYEEFGYITYHYGRWFYDDYYGWLWYPDYEWAPAWVEWRYDNDYIGWAPLHPYAVFSISIGIHFSNVYYTPYNHWHFVTFKHFCDPYVYNYYVGPEYRYRIYNKTKYRTNYTYYNGRIQNRGVDFNYVKVRTGQEIKQRDIVRVRDSKEIINRSGNNNNEIRTLDLKRDELVRNDLKRMDVKKDNRRTSLDVSKVELNRNNTTSNIDKKNNNSINTRNIDKTNNKNNDVVRENVNKNNNIDKNNVKTDRNTEPKVDIKKNTREVNSDNKVKEQVKVNNDIRSKDQVKTNNNNKVKEQVKVNNDNRTKTPDVNVKRDTDVRNQNQVDKKKQVSVNTNTRKQQTEVKTNSNKQNVKINTDKKKVQVNTNRNNSVNKNERKVQTDGTTSKDKSSGRRR